MHFKNKNKLHLSIIHWFTRINSLWLFVFFFICAHNLTLYFEKCIKTSFNIVLVILTHVGKKKKKKKIILMGSIGHFT
jgi:hypothetical protein